MLKSQRHHANIQHNANLSQNHSKGIFTTNNNPSRNKTILPNNVI
jgi:hypothetical protein